jgi:hypothetical protein
MQFFRDLRAVTGELRELVADDARHEEDAKLELAVSAQSFAQETREVVDDKLSFSATLMRAGEVDAAKRLLAEVEAEVRDNEVALIEQVNEVKVARAARRERITRMRLARSLAVAMLGAAVMATSAAGMAFANFLEDRSRAADSEVRAAGRARGDAVARAASRARSPRAGNVETEKVRFQGVTRALTPQALAAYQQLTSGHVEAGEVERLLSLLPAGLAHTVRQALTTAQVAEKTVKETVAELIPRPTRSKAKADKEEQETPADETPTQEPKDEEPAPDPSPTEDPQEEPEEDPDDTMGLPGFGSL